MITSPRIIIYGSSAECSHAEQLLRAAEQTSQYEILCVPTWSGLQQELTRAASSLLIVLTDGAAGMEGVFLARRIASELPVFWFSDDSQFGMQSHRLDCTYFSTKPITVEKLSKALQHCIKTGVRL